MRHRLFFLLTILAAAGPVQAQPSAKPTSSLPKVVLIGDSIQAGYAPLVAKRLTGRAVVVSVKLDALGSAGLLKNLDEILAREKPTIVHFDCGLHDLRIAKKTKPRQAEIAQYEANLKAIVARLKKEAPLQVVFANTTPMEADVQRTNAAAAAIMKDAGIPVNDLHWVAEKNELKKALAQDGVHYTPEGNERLAQAVADSVMRRWEVARAAPRYVAPTSDAQAGVKYRKAEAERDALVPPAFKKLKVGTFQLPENAAAWKKQRPDVHEKVVASLGDLPPRPSPQRVRLVSRELHAGYTLERVAIDNGEDGEVTALLLIPEKRRQPAPAILWLHSSTPDKNQLIRPNSSGGELSLGETFVRAGYVVLAPDACWYGDRAGAGPGGSPETYRAEPWLTPRELRDSFQQAQDSQLKLNLWLGRTLWGMMVHDDRIALDYLCSRPEVDKTRIGATGMSMGSTRAYWLAAVDDRIAATVCVACLTRYQNLINHGQLRAHGNFFFAWGLLKHFDSEGVLALIAPRPFLALTGDLDVGSPADGIKTLEEKVGRVYAVLGAWARFQSILYPDVGHAYTPQMRAQMLAWFARWLRPGISD